MRYSSLNVDLEKLATEIQVYLKDKNFEAEYFRDPNEPPTWFYIQATKSTKLRTIANMYRSLEIRIEGEPNNFDVSLTTGHWKGVASMPISPVITGHAAVGSSLDRRFRNNLWNFINQQTQNLQNIGSMDDVEEPL